MQPQGNTFLLVADAATGAQRREEDFRETSPLAFFRRVMREHPRLDKEYELELIQRVQDEADERARSEVVLHNLWIAYVVALRHRWSKVDLLDLIQEGVPGLIIAVERYDSGRGASFQTYASHWVRGTMRHAAVDTASLIHIPPDVHALAWRVRRLMRNEEWNWTATDGEVAAALGATSKAVRKARGVIQIAAVPIDEPMYAGESMTFAEVLPDTGFRPDLVALGKSEISNIRQRLEHLREVLRTSAKVSARVKSIFVEFYDLDGNFDRRTLDSVGQMFGMTREGVRVNIVRCWGRLPRMQLGLNQDSILTEIDRLHELENMLGG